MILAERRLGDLDVGSVLSSLLTVANMGFQAFEAYTANDLKQQALDLQKDDLRVSQAMMQLSILKAQQEQQQAQASPLGAITPYLPYLAAGLLLLVVARR